MFLVSLVFKTGGTGVFKTNDLPRKLKKPQREKNEETDLRTRKIT
jgi:hypothetical protein